ncbi:hypothetical protein EZL74_13000 [Flavobacterium silvisoli]|uniref:Uncharacterized protein n=1 Tax=Flavobacterium silvisoli TaxID=2529433 RepID=A0A4Q9YRP1_9FLAO|nr:hypothetical protein [Flavobacterium silvisoli]TBX64520.1 hypothetical protein EZL74_13000 [Flavobacterium silvisoli]
MKNIIFSIFIILLFSCNKKEISSETEKQIFESVLVPILDSIQFSVLPPPYNDSIKKIYENDKMLIVIKDSTEILSAEEQIGFLKHYKNTSMDIDSSTVTKINHNLIRIKNLNSHKLSFKLTDRKYIFKFYSELKENKLNDNEKFFCGELGLSNIKLDNSKEKGVFSISYNCCEKNKCGNGWIVYLKNTNGKWKIDKIIPTWIS